MPSPPAKRSIAFRHIAASGLLAAYVLACGDHSLPTASEPSQAIRTAGDIQITDESSVFCGTLAFERVRGKLTAFIEDDECGVGLKLKVGSITESKQTNGPLKSVRVNAQIENVTEGDRFRGPVALLIDISAPLQLFPPNLPPPIIRATGDGLASMNERNSPYWDFSGLLDNELDSVPGNLEEGESSGARDLEIFLHAGVQRTAVRYYVVGSASSTTETIGIEGGAVELPGRARVLIPSAVLDAPIVVLLEETEDLPSEHPPLAGAVSISFHALGTQRVNERAPLKTSALFPLPPLPDFDFEVPLTLPGGVPINRTVSIGADFLEEDWWGTDTSTDCEEGDVLCTVTAKLRGGVGDVIRLQPFAIGPTNCPEFYDLKKMEPTTTSSTAPAVIFIHGWQALEEDCTDWERNFNLDSFGGEVFAHIDNAGLRGEVQYYKYTYLTFNHIDRAAQVLSEELASISNRPIVLIGHSMGGLVARALIENYGVTDRVVRVITLGTPHRGAELADKDYDFSHPILRRGLAKWLVDTDGSRDLAPGSDFFGTLNSSGWEEHPGLYYTFAGVIHTLDELEPLGHGAVLNEFLQFAYSLYSGASISSDGIVGVPSARWEHLEIPGSIEQGYDHFEMRRGDYLGNQFDPDDPLLGQVAVLVAEALSSECTYSASLVGENPAMDSQLLADQSFTKTWIIRNTGTCAWDSSVQLHYVSGEMSMDQAPLPVADTVLPGATYAFSVTMQMPSSTGQYEDEWELTNDDGQVIPIDGEQVVRARHSIGSDTSCSDRGPIVTDPRLLNNFPAFQEFEYVNGLLVIRFRNNFESHFHLRVIPWGEFCEPIPCCSGPDGEIVNGSTAYSIRFMNSHEWQVWDDVRNTVAQCNDLAGASTDCRGDISNGGDPARTGTTQASLFACVAGCSVLDASLHTAARPIRSESLTSVIVFDADFDGGGRSLHFVDPATGTITRITSELVEETEPDFSLDGSKLAFIRENDFTRDLDIITMNSDGSEQMNITANSTLGYRDPNWSPDGTEIVFTRSLVMYIIRADGTNERFVRASPSFSPDWSPEGDQIAFASRGDIFLIRPDGTGEIRLTDSSTGDETTPAWSPDGHRIAYSCNGGICIMNSDGTHMVQLTQSEDDWSDLFPTWSPDGAQIAFVRLPFSASSRGDVIYIINVDGTGLRSLTPLDEEEEFDIGAPSWGARQR